MSKIRTMQQKVFEASIYDRNSEDQRRIMDALISKRQPPGRCKTLSQVIKTLRASQMKDGSTEQGNLRREYEYKRTRSKPFPTSPFPPLASLLVVTPDVSVSRIRGLYRWDNVTSRSLITKKKQTWEDKKCAILERAIITFSTTRRGHKGAGRRPKQIIKRKHTRLFQNLQWIIPIQKNGLSR